MNLILRMNVVFSRIGLDCCDFLLVSSLAKVHGPICMLLISSEVYFKEDTKHKYTRTAAAQPAAKAANRDSPPS